MVLIYFRIYGGWLWFIYIKGFFFVLGLGNGSREVIIESLIEL